MSKTLSTPIGEFEAKIDQVFDKSIEAYLGIRYAKALPFGLPEPVDSYMEKPANAGCGLRFPQQDVPPLMNRFLKNPMMRPEILTNADKTADDAFVLNIWTDGTGYEDMPFPQNEEIREVYDSELFDRLQKDFMRSRDANFIA